MKKLLALLLGLTFVLLLTACGNASINSADATIITENPTTDDTPVINPEDDYGYFQEQDSYSILSLDGANPDDWDISIFPLASDDVREMASIYSADVLARLENLNIDENIHFTNLAECELLSSIDGMLYDFSTDRTKVYNYISDGQLTCWYYPIVYRDIRNTVWVYYLNASGQLSRTPLIFGDSSPNGCYCHNERLCYVHNPNADENDFLSIDRNSAVIFDDETDILSVWRFGEMLCEHNLPAGAKYVGASDYVGYLFRVGTDIYALPDAGAGNTNYLEMHEVKLIASDVMYVIDPNYMVENCGLPLFLFQNDTVRFYCPWSNETADISDDLCSPSLYDEGSDR